MEPSARATAESCPTSWRRPSAVRAGRGQRKKAAHMDREEEAAGALGQARRWPPQGLRDGLAAGACAPHAVPPGVSVLRKDRTMPREPVDHGRIVYVVPPDFPERLELLQEESGLPWAEIARRLGTYPYTVWRWYRGRARPHFRHQMALLDLADELGLAHLLTAWTPPGRSAAREARQRRPARVRESWEESRASARRPPPQGLKRNEGGARGQRRAAHGDGLRPRGAGGARRRTGAEPAALPRRRPHVSVELAPPPALLR